MRGAGWLAAALLGAAPAFAQQTRPAPTPQAEPALTQRAEPAPMQQGVPAPTPQLILLERLDQRRVPVKAYYPSVPDSCRGIAVISHGAGGSEDGYRYLGEAMASLGYLAVVPGHRESGREAVRERVKARGLREGLAELITSPQAYQARFMDIASVTHWARPQCKGDDPILIGHSMGAATALLEAGAGNRLGLAGASAFKAYIAISPQGPGMIFEPNGWSVISRPVLTITGTRDIELESGTWESRTEPHRNLPEGCKSLAVVQGANHMQFAGVGDARAVEALTVQVIKAFLERVRTPGCPRLGLPIAGVEVQEQ